MQADTKGTSGHGWHKCVQKANLVLIILTKITSFVKVASKSIMNLSRY